MDQTDIDHLNLDLEPTAEPVEMLASSTSDSPTGFATTGRKITNWTSNLIATAVIAIIALVGGSHLVSSFSPITGAADGPAVEFELNEAWPVLESCALQFGESSIELQRDTVDGDRAEVISFLQARCREVLQRHGTSPEHVGEKEAQLVSRMLETKSIKPVEQRDGHWRIFHIENPKVSSPLPVVIGIRDHRPSNQSTQTNSDSRSSLAVWAIALPKTVAPNHPTDPASEDPEQLPGDRNKTAAASGTWTSFVGRVAVADELDQLKKSLIPPEARRTLAITGQNGESLIGFSGGQIEHTTRYFDDLASKRSWKTTHPWQQSGDSWVTSYQLPEDWAAQGIQVQLSVNHNQVPGDQSMRGLLIIGVSK